MSQHITAQEGWHAVEGRNVLRVIAFRFDGNGNADAIVVDQDGKIRPALPKNGFKGVFRSPEAKDHAAEG